MQRSLKNKHLPFPHIHTWDSLSHKLFVVYQESSKTTSIQPKDPLPCFWATASTHYFSRASPLQTNEFLSRNVLLFVSLRLWRLKFFLLQFYAHFPHPILRTTQGVEPNTMNRKLQLTRQTLKYNSLWFLTDLILNDSYCLLKIALSKCSKFVQSKPYTVSKVLLLIQNTLKLCFIRRILQSQAVSLFCYTHCGETSAGPEWGGNEISFLTTSTDRFCFFFCCCLCLDLFPFFSFFLIWIIFFKSLQLRFTLTATRGPQWVFRLCILT